jgi:hypothetical protein
MSLYFNLRTISHRVAPAIPCAIMAADMVTKRQLGIGIIALAAISLTGIFAIDWIGAGQWGGIGPLQQIGIGMGAAATIVGLLLIRLGDRPA